MTERSIARICGEGPAGSWEFSASNVSSGSVGADIDPIISINNFRIRVPVFAPHPHAGFSAVTFIFDDGEGEFIGRDSAGHEVRVGPGSAI